MTEAALNGSLLTALATAASQAALAAASMTAVVSRITAVEDGMSGTMRVDE